MITKTLKYTFDKMDAFTEHYRSNVYNESVP